MTETPITQADIDGLAVALDNLDLPAGQRALLTAIVASAAEVASAGTADVVPSFRDQFATAFTEGKANFLIGRDTPHSSITRNCSITRANPPPDVGG
jgi:hypothetical protein